jgi:hypothetical protein
MSGAASIHGAIAVYSGVKQTSQPDGTGNNTRASGSGSLAASVTTSLSGDWLIAIMGNDIGPASAVDCVLICGAGDGVGFYDSNGSVGVAGSHNITTSTVGSGGMDMVAIALAPAPSAVAPTVTTQAVSSITPTTATGNGNITATGGEDCDKRGVVYDTATQSAPGNVAPGSSGYDFYGEDTGTYGTGAFTKGVTSLLPDTTYYVRAYAHNSAGYAYGDEVSFTTLPDDITNLKEDFNNDSLDTAKWDNFGGAEVVEDNHQLEVTTTAAGSYEGIITKKHFKLTGMGVTAKLVNAGDQSIESLEVYPVYLKLDANNAIFFRIDGNTIRAAKLVASSYTALATVAYSSSIRWFRIRESGGTTYWDYSTDGVNWTNLTSEANPIAVTSLFFQLMAGTWQAEGSTTTAIFDDVNVIFVSQKTAAYKVRSTVSPITKTSAYLIRGTVSPIQKTQAYLVKKTQTAIQKGSAYAVTSKVAEVEVASSYLVRTTTRKQESVEIANYFPSRNSAIYVNDTTKRVGQSFESEHRAILESVKLNLLKSGSPTGSAYVKIYEITGSYGTTAVPTGSPLATSDALDVSTLSIYAYQQKTIAFSGANKILIESGHRYALIFEYADGTSSNYVRVGMDSAGSTYPGNPIIGTAEGSDIPYEVEPYDLGTFDLQFTVNGTHYGLDSSYKILSTVDPIEVQSDYRVYATIAPIEIASSYAVAVPTSQTKDASYAVRAEVAEEVGSAYAVRGKTAEEIASVYAVRSDVTTEVSSAYAIRSDAVIEIPSSYAIRTTEEAQEKDASYAVRASALEDVASAYAVRGSVTDEIACTYVIFSESAVTETKESTYAVKSNVLDEIASSYAVRIETAPEEKDAAYAVRASVEDQVEASYKIRSGFTQEVGSAYAILTDTTQAIDTSYAVATDHEQEKTSAYRIKSSSTTTVQSAYDIAGLISKSAQYAILTAHVQTVSSAYEIRTCPYSKKVTPYSEKASPFAKKTSPYNPIPC